MGEAGGEVRGDDPQVGQAQLGDLRPCALDMVGGEFDPDELGSRLGAGEIDQLGGAAAAQLEVAAALYRSRAAAGQPQGGRQADRVERRMGSLLVGNFVIDACLSGAALHNATLLSPPVDGGAASWPCGGVPGRYLTSCDTAPMETYWIRSSSVLWRPLVDGVVLLLRGSAAPMIISAPGDMIWHLLDSPRPLSDLARRLAHGRATFPDAMATVGAALAELEAAGVVARTELSPAR